MENSENNNKDSSFKTAGGEKKELPQVSGKDDAMAVKDNIDENDYTKLPFVRELLKEADAGQEKQAAAADSLPPGAALPAEVKNDVPKVPDEDEVKASERGDVPMSVVGHLDELRSRLIVTLVVVLVITAAGFFTADYLLDIITRPFFNTGNRLNIFNLTEGFLLNLKAGLIAGVLLGLPVIVYEAWKYIVPAIEKKNRRFIGLSVGWGAFLFYAGILFTYFVMLPVVIHLLLRFSPPDMTVTIGAERYLMFVVLFSLSVSALFEIPIVILILTRIGIITPQFLIAKRKYAILAIWVLAAVITPPDGLTQIMLAIPLMLLYEISIIVSKIVLKRRKKRELEKYI